MQTGRARGAGGGCESRGWRRGRQQPDSKPRGRPDKALCRRQNGKCERRGCEREDGAPPRQAQGRKDATIRGLRFSRRSPPLPDWPRLAVPRSPRAARRQTNFIETRAGKGAGRRRGLGPNPIS
ncbi:hypothetical protein P7K49_036399 [Saguinus oedipus]|uniref:Uncharacterized protein n=1 Tax=Saguinus oedipus TaxID=9490 RepID=A0ABQ9TJZ7_SAGOE|nr:hypothetical protein P7K49_036399 [Saguinus oedipus]